MEICDAPEQTGLPWRPADLRGGGQACAFRTGPSGETALAAEGKSGPGFRHGFSLSRPVSSGHLLRLSVPQRTLCVTRSHTAHDSGRREKIPGPLLSPRNSLRALPLGPWPRRLTATHSAWTWELDLPTRNRDPNPTAAPGPVGRLCGEPGHRERRLEKAGVTARSTGPGPCALENVLLVYTARKQVSHNKENLLIPLPRVFQANAALSGSKFAFL